LLGKKKKSAVSLSRKKPRKYQKKAFKRFKDERSAFLAMEMRLGKSLVAIRLVEKWKAERILVLAPKTVLLAWEDELDEEGHKYLNLSSHTLKEREFLLEHATAYPFMLLNYESVQKLEGIIEDWRPDCIICDESTKIKNARAGVTRTLLRMCDNVERKICLSGLPTPRSWKDVYSQCAFLGDGYFMGRGNYWNWEKDNTTTGFHKHDKFFSPKQQARVKAAFHGRAYVLTRSQAGIKDNKVRTRRGIELSPRDRKYYDYVEKYWEAPNPEEYTAKHAMCVQTYLRQWVAKRKMGELSNILDDIGDTESVVVWCAFNSDMDGIAETFRGRGILARKLNGETPDRNRKRYLAEFQAGKTRAIIVQMALGQFGIRLDRASIAIYYTTSYNFEERAQSEDRVVDVEKDEPLLIFDITTKDTIEEAVHENLQEKKTDAKYLMARIRAKRAQ